MVNTSKTNKSNNISKFNNTTLMSMAKNSGGIFCVLILISVFLSFLSPVFLTKNNLISVLLQITNNMFLALGMTLIIILGGIDLSVGSIVAMTGTLTVGFIVTNGMPIWISVLLGLAMGTACGLFNGFIIAKFKVPAFIVTLAMMNMASGIAYLYSGGRSTRIMDTTFSKIGTGQLFGVIPYPVIYMILAIIIFIVLLNKTKLGTYIYAVGGNRESARLSGIPIKKVEITVYALSGLLAAFAGIVLCSRMFSGQPSAGSGYEMDAIAACVLGGISMSGGIGRISGTILGAITIGIISNGLNLLGVSSFWQLFIKGMIILIAILIDSQKTKISSKNK